MSSGNGRRTAKLQDEISRQMGSEATRRYFATQPMFRAVDAIPDYLRELLDRLEQTELRSSAKPAGTRSR